jgi:hypothetical protein
MVHVVKCEVCILSSPSGFSVQGSPGNLVQFEELLFSNADIVVGTAVIAVRLSGELKARVSLVVRMRNKYVAESSAVYVRKLH